MEVVVLPDAHAVAEDGARRMAQALREEPGLAVAVATGNSPVALYARLAELQARGEADASRLRPVQLDEYRDLGEDDPRALWGWMERAFLAPLGLDPARALRLDGNAPDAVAECARMDRALAAAGGLGLAVLGLGPNGHLGFNEPPSGPDAPTRPVALTAESVRSNAVYWGGEERVPRRAVTLGMRPLLDARRILLVVTGAAKHGVLRRAVEEAPTPLLPASFLQDHPRAVAICDRAAWEGR